MQSKWQLIMDEIEELLPEELVSISNVLEAAAGGHVKYVTLTTARKYVRKSWGIDKPRKRASEHCFSRKTDRGISGNFL
jgi:hypothetical protein